VVKKILDVTRITRDRKEKRLENLINIDIES